MKCPRQAAGSSKEEAHDDRYFPEPNRSPLMLEAGWVESIRHRLPEGPDTRRQRFMSGFGLSAYAAGLLVDEKEVAAYVADCVAGRPRRQPTGSPH